MTNVDEPVIVAGPAGRLVCWRTGDGAPGRLPVLLIHPINLQGACWAEVTAKLVGYATLSPDLRGHGGSEALPPYGVTAWVEDCLTTMDHFGVARAHVVGGSLGGAIAVALAAAAPERVASIACFGSTLRTNDEALEPVLEMFATHGVQGTFERTLPSIGTAPGTSQEVINRALALSNPHDIPVVSEIWRAAITTDVRKAAAEVQCPALVVTGEYDNTCPVPEGQHMAAALGTEHLVLSGVGHLPMLEAADLTAGLITSFLSGQEA